MKSYGVDVTWKGTIVQRTIVTAENKEEAVKKIKADDVDDIVESFIEVEDCVDCDFYYEEEEQ